MRAALLLFALLLTTVTLAQGYLPRPSSSGSSAEPLSPVEVVAMVADAGTLMQANMDGYLNALHLQGRAPDGGSVTNVLTCNQPNCRYKLSSGSSSEIDVTSNVAVYNFSTNRLGGTTEFSAAACTSGNCYFSAATGNFVRFLPTNDLTGCGNANTEGGFRAYDTGGYPVYCDGTTLQIIAFRVSNTASVDFASMADGAQNAQTMTVTGAATTDVVHCSPLAAPEVGLAFNYFRVSSANTVTIVAQNNSGGVLDPVSISMKCIVTR